MSDPNEIPSYLTKAQVQNTLDIAEYEWNCVCGLENTPIQDSNCCMKVKFHLITKTYGQDINRTLGYASYPQCQNENAPCNPQTININATPQLLALKGPWKIDNQSRFNLIPVIQHEAGHLLGMRHIRFSIDEDPDVALPCNTGLIGDNNWGVMHSNPLAPGTFNPLSRGKLQNDDKCYFKKMYCPNGSIVGVDGGNSIAFSLPAYPNLARDIVNIPFKLNKQGGVKIVVYKENGEKIYTVLDVDNFPFGEHSIYYNTLLTSSGNYFYSVKTVEGVTISKFVIQR